MTTLDAVAEALEAWDHRRHPICPAVVHHGPGHQSKTHCNIDGDIPHTVHAATYGQWSTFGVWEGDETFDADDGDDKMLERYEAEFEKRANEVRQQRARFIWSAIK
jgi:hypothetical protein